MEKQIAPKTLVAVLAAQIKEEAEEIARKIVNDAKGNDVNYSLLVENIMIRKQHEKPVLLSDFANQILQETKGIEKFKELTVSLVYSWSFNAKESVPIMTQNNYRICLDINEKIKDTDWFNISASGTDNNLYLAYDEFKNSLETKILKRNSVPTETIIDSEAITK